MAQEQQDIYSKIFKASKPQEKEEEDIYSKIFKASKPQEVPSQPETTPEAQGKKKPPILDLIKTGLMPIVSQVPGLKEQFYQEPPKRKPGEPLEMRALTPKEKEKAEKEFVPEEKGRVRYEEMGGYLNYLLEQQPSRVAMGLTAFAGSPLIILLFEALQQVKNIGMSLKDKAPYDPLAQRMLSEMVPEDSPGWLKGLALGGEVAADMIIAGVTTGAIKEGTFRKSVNMFFDKAVKAGFKKEDLMEYAERVSRYGRKATLEEEIGRMMKISRAKIPSPLTRRVAAPETYAEPTGIKMPSRLAPPAGKLVSPEGVAFEPGTPESKVLEAGFRAVEPPPPTAAQVINIKPQAHGSIDVTMKSPEEPYKPMFADIKNKELYKKTLEAVHYGFNKVTYNNVMKYGGVGEEGGLTEKEALDHMKSLGKKVTGVPTRRKTFKTPTEKEPQFPGAKPERKAPAKLKRGREDVEAERAAFERKKVGEGEWEEGYFTDVLGQPGDEISWLGGRDEPRAIITWNELESGEVIYQSRLPSGILVMNMATKKPEPYFTNLEEAQKATEKQLTEKKAKPLIERRTSTRALELAKGKSKAELKRILSDTIDEHDIAKANAERFKREGELLKSKNASDMATRLRGEINALKKMLAPKEKPVSEKTWKAVEKELQPPPKKKPYETEAGEILGEYRGRAIEERVKAGELTKKEAAELKKDYGDYLRNFYRIKKETGDLESQIALKLKEKSDAELTPEEIKFLESRGIYKEEPAVEAKKLPEPEMEKELVIKPKYKKLEAKRMDLVHVMITDPTGKIEQFRYPKNRIKTIKAYAKKAGVEDKVRFSSSFKGRWSEDYPYETDMAIKQFIKAVKNVPREEWEKWEKHAGYPATQIVKDAKKRIQEKLKVKRQVKLDELKEELMKTDEGKVEWMYIETQMQLKERRKPSFKKAYRGAKVALVDTSANIKRDLLKGLGDEGKRVVIHHDLASGASAKAQREADEAVSQIYGGLNKKDHQLVDRAVQSRRTIAISGYKPDVKHPMELTGVEHEKYMAKIPEKINKRADIFHKKLEGILDLYEKEGIKTAEEVANLKSKGDYSPRRFIQHLDPDRTYTVGGKTITVPDSGIKSLKEGSYEVMELDSQLLLTNYIQRAWGRVFRNRAAKSAYELAKEIPNNGIFKLAKVVKTTEAGKPVYEKAPGGWTKIKAMVKGKEKEILMPDEYAKEWIQRDPLISDGLANFVGWLSGSKILKPLATGINPGFALTNFPRDLAHIWIVTDEYSSFLPKAMIQQARDLAATRKDAFGRKGRWIDSIDQGIGMNFLTMQGKPLQKVTGKLKNLQDGLSYAGETSEIWARLALRERALREGKDPEEATWIARNYLDFAQGGNLIKALDSGVPYVNAGTQATRGIFRAFADRPYQTLWKFAQLGLLASGLYLANRKNEECYKKVPPRDKVNNFIITTPFSFVDSQGNRRWYYFKIAKDQGQRFACTIFENLMKKILGEPVNADEITQAIHDFIPMIPSQSTPPTMDAFFGYLANTDFWTFEPIWKGEERKPRGEYTAYTHPALVHLGKLGLSPVRAEYALQQVFTRGNIYTSLVSGGLSMAMDRDKDVRKKSAAEIAARLPIIRRVFSITPPFDIKAIKRLEDESLEEATRRGEQKIKLNKIANKYYNKLYNEKEKDYSLLREAEDFVSKQPKPDRQRLRDWWRNYGKVYDVPNRIWWLRLAEVPYPESKALEFWTEYITKDKAGQKEMERLAKKVPGIWTAKFRQHFRTLQSKKSVFLKEKQ